MVFAEFGGSNQQEVITTVRLRRISLKCFRSEADYILQDHRVQQSPADHGTGTLPEGSVRRSKNPTGPEPWTLDPVSQQTPTARWLVRPEWVSSEGSTILLVCEVHEVRPGPGGSRSAAFWSLVLDGSDESVEVLLTAHLDLQVLADLH